MTDYELTAAELVEESRGKNVVHKAKLRALIDDWREEYDHTSETLGHRNCAAELEALVDDE